MSKFKAAALAYAKLGWAVFPLARGTKVPAVKGGRGVHDATVDQRKIEEWARLFPDANVGIACGKSSGIVVIDIDPRNGADGTMANLSTKGYTFPSCPCVQTTSNGRHLYFRWDERIANSKNRLGPGIDVKSTGGYVVAPPSQIDGGGSYRWLTRPDHLPRLPIWAATILAPAPRPVQHQPIYKSSTPSPEAFQALMRFLGQSPQGERNNRLYWVACRTVELVKSHQVSQDGAINQIIAQAVAIGLPHREAIATIRSAFFVGPRD